MTYNLVSEYTEMQITSAVESLKRSYPEQFSNINEEEFKQLVTLNLQKLLE